MKKILYTLAAMSMVMLPGAALADSGKNIHNNPAGGYTGPTVVKTVSAAAVDRLGDDEPVVLIGKIEKHLGGEEYRFVDASGSLVLEIEAENWRGLKVGADDTVEIWGETDKDVWSHSVEVERIIKI